MADSQSDLPGFDMQGAADRIGASLFPQHDTPTSEPEPTPEPGAPEPIAQTQSEPVVPLDVPKSWKQDMHDYWPKLDRKVQEYYIQREKQMLDGLEQYKRGAEYAKPFMDVLQPYSHLFTERKPHEMVSSLLRAHQLLTQGSVEDRRKAYEDLGRNLQLIQEQTAQTGQADPVVSQLSQKLSTIEQVLQAQQQQAFDTAKAEATKQVDAFAADTKAHPYFDEVAEDMMRFLRNGASLQEAYDAAVSFNPAVRAKEHARIQTEAEAALKEKARLEALPKKKAAGVNVRGQDTGRTPTEPVGSIDDTIRGKLREIRARAS